LKQYMMRHWSGALPAKIMSGPEARGLPSPKRSRFGFAQAGPRYAA